jgi:endonuclease YncB( thermonuclease family)
VRITNAVAIASNDRGAPDVAVTAPKIELLQPNRGTPGLHRNVARGEGMAVDLGFKLYRPLAADQARRLGRGDIVQIKEDDSLRRLEGASQAEVFTYAATLRRVVDGDTLVVDLEVSPEIFIEQTLRLRGKPLPRKSSFRAIDHPPRANLRLPKKTVQLIIGLL